MTTPTHNHLICRWTFKRMCKECEALIRDETDVEFLKHHLKSKSAHGEEDAMGMFRYLVKYPESGIVGTKCPLNVKLQHMEDTWKQIQKRKKSFLATL
jgi:hypothetical protein